MIKNVKLEFVLKLVFNITGDFDKVFLPLEFSGFHGRNGYCYLRVQIKHGFIVFSCAQLLNYYRTSVTNAIEQVREAAVNALLREGVLSYTQQKEFLDVLKTSQRVSKEIDSQLWDYINANSIWFEYYNHSESLFLNDHFHIASFEGNKNPVWRKTSLADLEKTYPEFDFIIHKHHLEKWMNGGLTAENVKKMIKEKGWNNKMLAARWGCSEVWVSKIINDENRKVQWNDAINGLPVISDNMV
ncbi:TPA: hypothetical protein SHY07_004617 [Escherichia coli]|uniref:Uncharacterized protein n=2 Tax=Enterobacteriaceae TaxID=543 RepID=A0A7H9RL82_ECOLX|nr:hypothetical protein [Escherichia coli]EHU7578307.1 hypothetical protein [Salmonella enterica subsp. enterica serovar Alachua]EHX5245562.1 hypothetical protein [Salmonella enterica]EHX7027589.1 hypothetical protein [Salmonella enterica subsp. enterica serovar Paratyphi B]EIC3357305.1 hypothetical protein [Salmonella enterica subsp. enterica serovar Dublin]HCD0375166.1 hypothetical protein [Salmonella enterica subsp. enterica serovar Infantis]HDW4142852.1 hypothetical protein [Salmonella en